MAKKSKFAGIVLAGGKSSRMKTDKALLEINGQSMLARKVALLESLGAEKVVVSRNENDFVSDLVLEKGPMGGIYSALESLKKDKDIQFVLVVPIDMPLLDKSLLEEILNAGLAMQCPTYFEGHQLPLFLPINDDIKKLVKRIALSDSDRSIKRLLNFATSDRIVTGQLGKLVNTNDPVQWQAALTQLTNTGDLN